MVICLERGADLHMAQLMPLPLTVSCFSKIQIGFTFLVPAHLGSPVQRAIKRVCVCVCLYMHVDILRVVIQVSLHWPGPVVKSWRILLKQSFTVYLLLLMAASGKKMVTFAVVSPAASRMLVKKYFVLRRIAFLAALSALDYSVTTLRPLGCGMCKQADSGSTVLHSTSS